MAMDFYTPSEVAQILRVPQRRILGLLDAGEIEAERDPRTGRWRVPKDSLNVSETELLTELLTEGEEGLRARLQTTEEALSERYGVLLPRALREERDRLGEELEAERSKGFWRRFFGG